MKILYSAVSRGCDPVTQWPDTFIVIIIVYYASGTACQLAFVIRHCLREHLQHYWKLTCLFNGRRQCLCLKTLNLRSQSVSLSIENQRHTRVYCMHRNL